MKTNNRTHLAILMSLFSLIILTSCDKDDDDDDMNPSDPVVAMYEMEDQMGRPAINTVFVSGARKDEFNQTIPSEQGAAFQQEFQDNLLALNPGYTTNLLGLDAAGFTGVLASDVLTVSTTGTTTFFDGTNVLTGRNLSDDVITVELILLFGGPDAMANPGLTDDNVSQNDLAFSSLFPYLASPH